MARGTAVRRSCELVAAALNGVVVFLLPAVLVGAAVLLPQSNTSTTVRASDASLFRDVLHAVTVSAPFTIPLALVAAWRTWVHANRWHADGERGWRGVAEGGVLGFAVALLVLSRAIVRSPLESPPYILVYGVLGALVGVILALPLRFMAVVVLKVCGVRRGQPR